MISFDKIDTSTTMIIADLSCEVNPHKMLSFLTLSRAFHDNDTIVTKNNKNDFNTGNKGEIITARFNTRTRGLRTKGRFKNSILGYLSSGEGILHYTISKKTIILAGHISTIEKADDIFDIIAAQIRHAYDETESLSSKTRRKILSWFYSNFKGKRVTVYENSLVIYDPDTPESVKTKEVHKLIIPKSKPNLPKYWYKAIIQECYDCYFFEEAAAVIEQMVNKEKVCSNVPNIMNVDFGLESHNYNIGFKLNVRKIHELFNPIDGIYSTYISAVHSNVKIEIPYIINKDYADIIRKKDAGSKDLITVTANSTGYITLTGRVRDLNEIGYNTFMTLIFEHRDAVEL